VNRDLHQHLNNQKSQALSLWIFSHHSNQIYFETSKLCRLNIWSNFRYEGCSFPKNMNGRQRVGKVNCWIILAAILFSTINLICLQILRTLELANNVLHCNEPLRNIRCISKKNRGTLAIFQIPHQSTWPCLRKIFKSTRYCARLWAKSLPGQKRRGAFWKHPHGDRWQNGKQRVCSHRPPTPGRFFWENALAYSTTRAFPAWLVVRKSNLANGQLHTRR
jgi:hypothetical protein